MVFQDWIKGFAYNSKKEGFFTDTVATQEWTNEQLSNKANQRYVDNRLSNKASQTYVDNRLNNKASQTYVDNRLNNKANHTYVDNRIGENYNFRSDGSIDDRLDALENYEISNDGYGRITGAQQRLINITEQEKDRLDNIHQNYRDQDDNRDKMQMLMLSEKDKQNKYMLLAVIFAFVFVVAFFFTYIQNVKKNKSVWFDIIMVLLIAAALIYAIVVYIDIQNRDPNNFSKLAPDSDSLLVVETRTGDGKHGVKYGIAATTDLQGGGCKGDACCGPGSSWDESSKRCIQNPSS